MQSIAERGLQAIFKVPNTSKKHPQNRIYSYLLRKLAITLPLSHMQACAAGQRVQRHYLHSGQERLFVSGGDYGLGDPQGFDHCPAVHVCMHERGGGFPIRFAFDDCSNHLPVIDVWGHYLDNIFPSHRLRANHCPVAGNTCKACVRGGSDRKLVAIPQAGGHSSA
jgi:hypothetical protein